MLSEYPCHTAELRKHLMTRDEILVRPSVRATNGSCSTTSRSRWRPSASCTAMSNTGWHARSTERLPGQGSPARARQRGGAYRRTQPLSPGRTRLLRRASIQHSVIVDPDKRLVIHDARKATSSRRASSAAASCASSRRISRWSSQNCSRHD